MTAAALARAAGQLVGTPFRLHGRDPQTGLDCVGVLACSLEAAGHQAPLPTAYRLRRRETASFESIALACGFEPATTPAMPGDVVMVRTAPCQYHLMIGLDGKRFIHAHAGLKRVVAGERPSQWPVVAHWRLSEPN